MSESKSFTIEAEEFVGQDIEGVDVQHLGVDEVGLNLSQAVVSFPGGSATAQQGDWIGTFPSGQKVVLTKATWGATVTIPPENQAKVEKLQSKIEALTPEVEAATQAKIDKLQAEIDALTKAEADLQL